MRLTHGEVLYYVLKPPVSWYLRRLFNISVEANPLREVREPYLLLGHHVTNLDPVIGNMCANRLVRFIAGDANQDSLIKRFLLALVESIPFAKNRSDAKSIRRLVRHVQAGRPVGLYPEGGRNWDGATDRLVPATAKLIKLLRIPVYGIFYKGGYLSRPRWADFPRRGKMVVEIKQLFSREAVREKSAEEIYAGLVDKLAYNEYAWQARVRIPFPGKNLAEHIERLLYLCPHCQAVDSLVSQGDKFHCTRCKSEYIYNEYGDILGCRDFADTVTWNQWQRGHLPRIVAEGFSFANRGVALEKKDIVSGARERRTVDMTFTPDAVAWADKDAGESIAVDRIASLSLTFEDMAEFYVGKTKYRFTFNPRRHMSIKLFFDLLQALTERNRGNQAAETEAGF